jgi:anti-sigma factor RsiW
VHCDQARTLLDALLDDELDPVWTLEVEQHLEGCPACRSARDARTALRDSLRDPGLRFAPPVALEGRVRDAVRRAGSGGGWARLRRTALRPPAWLAAAAVLVLAVVVYQVLPRGSREPAFVQQVVSSHVRALMPGHLTDVASSEHHTVKPWFAGRLDYSPPVPDLDRDGFTLEGARIDYVDDRPVAALVYRRRQHVISLFAWPAAGAAAGSPQIYTRRGYNVLHWTAGPATFCAVSDLNEGELRAFGRLVSPGT